MARDIRRCPLSTRWVANRSPRRTSSSPSPFSARTYHTRRAADLVMTDHVIDSQHCSPSLSKVLFFKKRKLSQLITLSAYYNKEPSQQQTSEQHQSIILKWASQGLMMFHHLYVCVHIKEDRWIYRPTAAGIKQIQTVAVEGINIGLFKHWIEIVRKRRRTKKWLYTGIIIKKKKQTLVASSSKQESLFDVAANLSTPLYIYIW